MKTAIALALLLAVHVAHAGTGLVFAIDTHTAQLLRTIAVGQVPNAVLVDD